ncbi:ATP-dependent DNA helicase RecG [Clostridium thermarum]|uniref:ATP-dependent DNA helicase RecG n=1 Tax=Clostridium thermarum TaxID=1716543 RepID=UPI0013D355E9|nr:ATP-dependent DNA helicase RecG [Clostridium thermarum]
MDLSKEISFLKGVGPKLKAYLNDLDIFTVKDLLLYFPRDYEFVGTLTRESKTEIDHCMVEGRVTRIDRDNRSKTGKVITTIYIDTGQKKLACKWFNQPYIKNSFRINETYRLYGKLNVFQGKEMLCNAKIVNNLELNTSILPKYSLTRSLTSSTIMKLVRQVLESTIISENLPETLLHKYKLMSLDEAIRNIHMPESKEKLEGARKRLKFQELFAYSLKILMLKKYNRSINGGRSYVMAQELTDLRDSLPFELTKAQRKVIREILLDQKNSYAMNRLLQGDVGSGKTVIALIALFNIIKNGYQAALMVPTEILANQHYAEAQKILGKFDINIVLLTGSLSPKNKQRIKEEIREGRAQLIIGTHAILEEDVEFSDLAMIVTDEQHRFGVYQRAKLLNKGNSIEVLVMSATPIPRTLSLFVYGDLDISIIDELPPGRQKIDTILIERKKRENAYKAVIEEINKGRQAYIVCPMIEDSENLELQSVKTLYDDLKKSYFKNIPVAVLHGKMTPSEKDATMADFKSGNTKALIATTVIEVGVNVPNASVMVIENAERFGLAQLHQLRGRVGRGGYKSYCILIADIKNDNIKRRMDIMVETNDGFKIAEEDMRLRGSGDMFGINQSGDAGLMLADIYEDSELLKVANKEARNVLNNEEEYRAVIDELKEAIESSSKYICFN